MHFHTELKLYLLNLYTGIQLSCLLEQLTSLFSIVTTSVLFNVVCDGLCIASGGFQGEGGGGGGGGANPSPRPRSNKWSAPLSQPALSVQLDVSLSLGSNKRGSGTSGRPLTSLELTVLYL